MRLRGLVLAVAAIGSWQGRAAACSVVLPEKQSLECGAPGAKHTSVANARLQLDAVEVKRSLYAPPGRGDCGELGSTRLRFRLAGGAQSPEARSPEARSPEAQWPQDVGVLVTLRKGKFTYFQPPPTTLAAASGWLLLPQAGAVRFFGPDDPHQPLALVLEARAVDCSGAVSAPIEVRVDDPGRPPDAGSATNGGAASGAVSGGAAGTGGASGTAGPAVASGTAGAAGAAPADQQRLANVPKRFSCALGATRSGAPAALGLWLTALLLALRSKTARVRAASPARRRERPAATAPSSG